MIYLDMDGVLADFDKAAELILNTDNIYKWEFVYGSKEFWRRLNEDDGFFLHLPVMDDAPVLLDAIGTHAASVLTALPHTNGKQVALQKQLWVDHHVSWRFDGALPVITCLSKEKPDYCTPGDVLIDDRAINQAAWEERGGSFILHKSASDSVRALKELEVI